MAHKSGECKLDYTPLGRIGTPHKNHAMIFRLSLIIDDFSFCEVAHLHKHMFALDCILQDAD